MHEQTICGLRVSFEFFLRSGLWSTKIHAKSGNDWLPGPSAPTLGEARDRVSDILSRLMPN